MSQVTEQSVRFQTALASIKLIQASAVLDLTEDDFDFLTSNKVWIATRSEERFSRNAETDLVCRLLLEIKNAMVFWMAIAHSTAFTTLPNSARTMSRALWSRIIVRM